MTTQHMFTFGEGWRRTSEFTLYYWTLLQSESSPELLGWLLKTENETRSLVFWFFFKSHQIWKVGFLQSKPRPTVRRKQRFSENTDIHVPTRSATFDKRETTERNPPLKFLFPKSTQGHILREGLLGFWGISKSTATLYEGHSYLFPLYWASALVCDLMLSWSRVNTWHFLHGPVIFPNTHL